MILRPWMVAIGVPALLAGCLMGSGCATPVGVSEVGPDRAYIQVTESAISGDAISLSTRMTLHRYDLLRAYEQDPLETLLRLQALTSHDSRRDILLALSELSYSAARHGVHGKIDGRKLLPRDLYAPAAVYAYLFLLGPGEDPVAGPYDRTFRLACDLYNQSLDLALVAGNALNESERVIPLLKGSMRVRMGRYELPQPLKDYEKVVPADQLAVHGLSVRDRDGGLGSPVIAVQRRKSGVPIQRSSAATIFARIEGDAQSILDGKATALLDIYSPLGAGTVKVGGANIPLETDRTAQLAYALNDPFLWAVEKNLFLLSQSPFKQGIYSLEPYTPGRIPVVFVHGTMSSPVWWAEMLNTLRSDPSLRAHYQFWFYLYDSAKPILLSAHEFRDALTNRVAKLDPEGKDAALQDMVVVGHSQGGLLTKLTATETGDTMLRAVAGKKLDELKLSPKSRAAIEQFVVLHPLPEVRRVIFIATPHRGSYQAGGLARSLARRFITLPKAVLERTGEILNIIEESGLPKELQGNLAHTSIDSMSPKAPGMLALAQLPVAPGITAHSIIAIKGDDQPPKGKDGVVAYTSAHVDYAESELIVRSGHSCQDKPATIEEVRRILLEHLESAASVTATTNR